MDLTVGVRIAVTLLINRFCNLDLLADDPLFYADRPVSYTHLDVYKRQLLYFW